MARVMVAMSGGVDSSLVAALLHEQGYAVTGVTMHLWEGEDAGLCESQCCSQEMVAGARRVCAQLGIPYYVFNYQQEFRRSVINYFLHEYMHGYTPNPCLACNRDLKFRYLFERAQVLGFDYLATGHYAQIESKDGHYQLLRSIDAAKDQSYVLYMLQQRELARVLFPLGGYTKTQVREMARQRGLATADRPESQDICFIPDNDYRRFLREAVGTAIRPGPIVDLQGHPLGTHQGLPYYTVGQRKGLGLSGGSEALFVVALDPERNLLIVGPSSAMLRDSFEIEQVCMVDEEWPTRPMPCAVQVRAHAASARAEVVPLAARRLHVQLLEPLRAVTPGQAAVLYADCRVIGGGRIMRL